MPSITEDNSYATIEQADDYCDSRLGGSAWGSDEDEKARALIDATRDLNVLSWQGTKTELSQALQWPRSGVIDPDDPNELELPDDEIPRPIIDATCELAFQYLTAGSPTLAVPNSQRGVIRKKVDVLETEWESGDARPETLYELYKRAYAMIEPFLDDSQSGLEVRRM